MRSCHIYGNGASCDICHRLLNPFEIHRIKGTTLHPGAKYPQVSSDTREKIRDKFHLCENCYEFVITSIKNAGKINITEENKNVKETIQNT